MSEPESMPSAPTPDADASPERVFRIFISSPGDLGEERIICARIIERLKGEFSKVAHLQPILWEQEPLTADVDFQGQIPLPSQTDLVVLMLWSRMGYRLHSRFKASADEEAPTGTLFEFRDAISARRVNPEHVPDVMVYRKTAEPPKPSISDSEKYLQALEEWGRVEAFFQSEYFRDAEQDVFVGAFHTFKRAGEFAENFEHHLRTMIVRRLGEHQSATPSWTKGSPFRGLEIFDFEHHALFRGRATAIAEVLDALRNRAAAGCAFVMITGMSGGGKSSLARAGVLPDLTQPGVIEGIGLWRRAILRPAEARGDIFQGLALALLPTGAKPDGGIGLPELAEDEDGGSADGAARRVAARMRHSPDAGALLVEGALRQAAEATRAAEREKLLIRRQERAALGQSEEVAELDRQLAAVKLPHARLALVIDQMEELFTDPRLNTSEREAFIETLDALARGGRTWIVATLRSDFFAQCEKNPTLIGLKAGDGTYHLLPPNEAAIGRMIRHPATAAGLEFEIDLHTQEFLADVLMAAATKDPGALPLLEFTLDELYKRAAAENRQVLKWDDYRALGGLEGALATRAEAVYGAINKQNPQAAAALPSVFSALARLASGGGPDTGAEAAAVVSQSAPLERFEAGADELVHAMIEARLLVSDRGQVRVAHEALFRHWGRAKDWIKENQIFLRVHARVTEAAERWRAENESEDFLLIRGKPLAEGEELLAQRRGGLSADEIAFIEASSALHRREEEAALRRRHRVLAVISCALVLALVFAGNSFWLYGKADAAAKRATHARNEAEKLIDFMGVDLRDKLTPIGRLELLDSTNQRVRAYYDAFAADPGEALDDNVLRHQSMTMLNEGEVLLQRGDLPGALKLFRDAQGNYLRLAAAQPDNTERQEELAHSDDRIGGVLGRQRDLQGALQAYTQCLDIRLRLIARDPANRSWQRDLAASRTRIGEILTAQGNLPGALQSFRQALDIHLENTRREPANLPWQQDLFSSYLTVGDTLFAQNDSAGALAAYRAGVAVQQKLSEKEPKNLPWQRDLAVSSERIADTLEAQGDQAGALAAYRDALSVHRRLAAYDPTNADWQRDLFVGMTRVGDILLLHGDAAEALGQFSDGLAIQSELLKSAPGNVEWQRNTAVAHERVGQALEARHDSNGALTAFQASLDVRRKMSEHAPDDPGIQHDVVASLANIGDSLLALGRAEEALRNYREAFADEEKLVARDPSNSDWQRDLAEIADKTGEVLRASQSIPAAETLALLRRGESIYAKFAGEQTADEPTRALWAMALSHLGQALAQQTPVPAEAALKLTKARDLFRELAAKNVSLDARQTKAMKNAETVLSKLLPTP